MSGGKVVSISYFDQMVATSVVEICYGFRISGDNAYEKLAEEIKTFLRKDNGCSDVHTLPPRPSWQAFCVLDSVSKHERHQITDAFQAVLVNIIAKNSTQAFELHGPLDYRDGEDIITVIFGPTAIEMNSQCVDEGQLVVKMFDPSIFQSVEEDIGQDVTQARQNLVDLHIDVTMPGWLRVEYTC